MKFFNLPDSVFDFGLVLSGLGSTILFSITPELFDSIRAFIIGVITVGAAAWFRWRKFKAEQKRITKEAEQKLLLEKRKYEQELEQDREKHDIEMKILTKKLEEK